MRMDQWDSLVQGQFWKLWDKSQNSYFGLKISKATRRRGGEGRKEEKREERKEKEGENV